MQQTQIELEKQLTASERRAQQYWHEDGIVELGVGLLFMLVGVMFLVEGRAADSSPLAHISALGLPILVIGGIFGGRWLIHFAKRRITYPRTGYAGLRRVCDARRQRVFTIGAAAGLAGAIAYMFFNAPAAVRWMSLVQGVAVGGMMLMLAYRLNLTRYYIFALLSTCLGVALLWSPWNDSLTTGTFYGAMGVLLMATGGWVLAGYLRRRPTGGAA